MEHDFTVTTGQIEREIALDAFPSPEQLWQCYCQWKGIDNPQQAIITQEYYDDSSGKVPRYYQVNAINRTVEASIQLLSKQINRF
ncbi:hypothetical protein H6G83_02740 [Anabaena azotica FACHB-119]|uniref:Uncharacterized protein n=1 Tax=Anabaena azotica FACHB-119 TaxID=947527 RepID=A0ABR8CX77_9NOST|nr:hypothetical protein [Anabaena azotica]MBD2499544.1 hypothetical protein [Anabaena azotica FACHB-119]